MNAPLVFLGLLFFFGQILSFAAEGRPALVTTSLTSPLDATASTANVDDASGFAASGVLFIDREFMEYTAHTGTSFTGLVRGTQSSDASGHSANAQVLSEVAGLAKMGIEFKPITSKIPLVGEFQTVLQGAGVLARLVGKIIVWDFSYWDGNIMGLPLVYGQYALFFVSMAFLFTLAARAKDMIPFL